VGKPISERAMCRRASADRGAIHVIQHHRDGGSVNLIWPLSIVSFGPTPTLVVRFVEIAAAVGAVGKVGIARVVRDFQGRWEGRKTCFWFSSLSTDRLFPQPGGRRVFVFCKKHRSSLSSCRLQARVPIRTSTAVLPPPGRTRVQTEGVRRASWQVGIFVAACRMFAHGASLN
jgi:hypothetical protein